MRATISNWLFRFLATIMLAAGISACGGGGGGGGNSPPPPATGTFRFVNTSGITIERLYLWPESQGTSQQGPDQLGSNVLVNGATFDLTDAPCDTPMHYRAITATGADGSYLYWTDVGNTAPRSTPCGGTFTLTLTNSQTTGTLTIFLNVDTGGGQVALSVDGVPVYTFTQFVTSGAPDCGVASASGTYTAFVSPGNHTYSARNANATWGPGNVNVPAGGCFRLRLF